MGKNVADTIRRNYKDRALKLLFKHDSPSRDDVWHTLCRELDGCPNPDNVCNFPGGPLKGRNCPHVISVDSLANKAKSVLNDCFEF